MRLKIQSENYLEKINFYHKANCTWASLEKKQRITPCKQGTPSFIGSRLTPHRGNEQQPQLRRKISKAKLPLLKLGLLELFGDCLSEYRMAILFESIKKAKKNNIIFYTTWLPFRHSHSRSRGQNNSKVLLKDQHYGDMAIMLNIEIKVDGKTWKTIDVKDQLSNEALNELEVVYQKITNDNNKNNVNNSKVTRQAVHQLRKK
jgi:hypothetical protein